MAEGVSRILSLAEAAALLKAHPDTVSEAIKQRGLPAARVGRSYILIEEDVIAWLRTQYHRPSAGQDGPEGPSVAADIAASPSRTTRALAEALAPQKRPRRGYGPDGGVHRS